MKFSITRSLVATCLVLGLSAFALAPVHAQGSSVTRAQVKMERDAFFAMAYWNSDVEMWVIRDDMPMPNGVKSRAEVKAMRDEFLSVHTWNSDTAQWIPVKGAPRDMSKLTRAEVKAETTRFLKMYRFNEQTAEWVPKNR